VTYNRILPGNNIDTLKTLPDNSVDCCVTSPPYYGLRDYGTAVWIGGSSDCNHFRDNKIVNDATFTSGTFAKGDSIYKHTCEKCGARREDFQIGLEQTPEEYIKKLVAIFREVRRVLKPEGTLWVNIGDSYAGSGKGGQSEKKRSENWKPVYPKHGDAYGLKPKDLIGIPWMLAFALRADGWYLRQNIIWSKPSPMPESVKDRFCKSHEHIFLLSKEPRYFFDHRYALEPATGYDGRKEESPTRGYFDQEVWGVPAGTKRERWPQRGYATKDGHTGLTEQRHGDNILTNPLRTKRDVWVIASEPSELSHFAMFPQKLILPCIMCGCPENGIVLDPFMGSGTTGVVAIKNLRKYIGCEINPEYIKIAKRRIKKEIGFFNEEA
jgi:DNA modification methylase